MDFKNRYFQFPMAVFRPVDTFREYLENALAWTFVEWGRTVANGRVRKLEELGDSYPEIQAAEEASKVVRSWLEQSGFEARQFDCLEGDDIDEWGIKSQTQVGIVKAAQAMRFMAHPESILRRYESLKETAGDKPLLTRIASQLFRDTMLNQALKPLEFQVLCGVFATIGIYRDRIAPVRINALQSLCCGYQTSELKSLPVRERELVEKRMPSRKQVSAVLGRLHKRKLFSRLLYRKRDWWYSKKSSNERAILEFLLQEPELSPAEEVQRELDARSMGTPSNGKKGCT